MGGNKDSLQKGDFKGVLLGRCQLLTEYAPSVDEFWANKSFNCTGLPFFAETMEAQNWFQEQ